jgi:hypothetical protein
MINTKIDTPTDLKVIFLSEAINSYEKSVRVVKDNTTYIAFINYDEWDGYSIVWTDDKYKDIDEPTWASEYAEATSYHDLAYLLDEMGKEK